MMKIHIFIYQMPVKLIFFHLLLAWTLIFLEFSQIHADVTGVETLGSARFTVVTPQLIRMEYAADGKFVDAASWFARNRNVRDTNYKVQKDDNSLTIDTGIIHLVYTNDGKSFDADNLKADVKSGNETVSWKAGMEQTGNLGGIIRGLDRKRAAVPLEPGLLSRDGWYLLDDSNSVLATSDWFEERPASHGTDWYFFGYGLNYKAALKSLTTISGEIPLPRKNVMGTWYSRNFAYTEDEFKEIVGEYHDHDFPLDNIVMDYGWHIPGWTGYTWNKKKIPDPDGLLKWYHDQGLSVTINDHPDSSVQPQESMYADFMRAMGQDPSTKQIIPYDGSDKHFMDTFWEYTHAPLMKQGVDFWWLDWGKPPVSKLPSLDGLSMLNDYYFKKTDTDGKRGLSFSRWAGWGDHRNPIHFSGDADSGWKMLAFEVPFTSTSGNVGCFFWSHDTGGYRGGRNEESYTRWTQFSALSATLRSHAAGAADMDRRPWKWPSWAEESMRRSFHLRSNLIPYVYTCAEQAVKASVPFVRPMYIDHPTEEAAYHNGQQYYFGDNLLVAPITAPGQGANHLGWQHVWFPGGTWYQYFSGEKYADKGDVLVAADINEFPLFERGGVPLPEQPYTERPTSTPLSNLVLRCFPGTDGQTGTSQLYEDDGISDDYKTGGFATTALSYSRQGNEITIHVAPAQGSFKGQVASRSYTVLLPDTQQGTLLAPSNAKLTYDPMAGINRIEIPAAPVTGETIIKVTAADLDPVQVRQKAMAQRLDGLLGKPYAQWTDADRTGLTPGLADAVQAIHGIGLMAVNQNPYLYGNDVRMVYYDPSTTQPVSGTLSFKSWSEPVTITPEQPFDFKEAAMALAPEDTISVPGVENRWFLIVNGHEAVSFDTAEVAYNLGNLALDAKPSTSNGRGENAIDGVAQGAPVEINNEWNVKPGTPKTWIKLTWPKAIKAKRILLYDRPNPDDQVVAGKLKFSDGSSLDVGTLPNDGKTPLNLTFPEKEITWVQFEMTQGSPTTKSGGLSEFGVFDR
jgi:hypothetical protein